MASNTINGILEVNPKNLSWSFSSCNEKMRRDERSGRYVRATNSEGVDQWTVEATWYWRERNGRKPRSQVIPVTVDSVQDPCKGMDEGDKIKFEVLEFGQMDVGNEITYWHAEHVTKINGPLAPRGAGAPQG